MSCRFRKLPSRILRSCCTLYVLFGLLFSSGEGIQLLPFAADQLNHSAPALSDREDVSVRADGLERLAWITKSSSKHDSWQHHAGTGRWNPGEQLILVPSSTPICSSDPGVLRSVLSGSSGSRAPPEYLYL